MVSKRWLWAILIPSVFLGCRDLSLPSQWLENPLVPFGNEQAWRKLTVHRLEPVACSLAVANDSQAVYLWIQTEEPSIVSGLMKQGIRLSFRNEGEKSPSLRIRFFGADSLLRPEDPIDSFWPCLTEDQRNRYRASLLGLQRMIFVERDGSQFRIPSDGFAARILGQGYFGYAFRIPLDSGDAFGIRSKIGDQLILGIRIGDPGSMNPGSIRNNRTGVGRMRQSSVPGRIQEGMPENEIRILIHLARR